MSSNLIISYASKLIPIFKKDKFLEDARVIQTELTTNAIPSYLNAVDMFMPSLVKSKELNNLSNKYFNLMHGSNNKGMIFDISQRLPAILSVVEFIENNGEKKFESSIVVDGLTLQKATMLKVIELCGFISRYSLRLLNYAYILEVSALNDHPEVYITNQLSTGEIKELELYLPDFCMSIAALSSSPKNFLKVIDTLPDVTVGTTSEATLANIGSVKLDPLNIFSLNGFITPIYRIGMMFAEYSVSRYKEAKELKTNLELRRLYLENYKQTGESDASIQKEIDVIQSRIDRCSEQIRKTEEKVGM